MFVSLALVALSFPSPFQTLQPTSQTSSQQDTNPSNPQELDSDMNKLNEFLQQEKENSVHTEQLYADMSRRFLALKQQYQRDEEQRKQLRSAMVAAQTESMQLSKKNARLTAMLSEVRKEQEALAAAKTNIFSALGIGEKLQLSGLLENEAAAAAEEARAGSM